jgi:hypothetical protein
MQLFELGYLEKDVHMPARTRSSLASSRDLHDIVIDFKAVASESQARWIADPAREIARPLCRFADPSLEAAFQGAAEAILPGHSLPTIIEPKGAVPKKGKDEFRDISDARTGNKTIPKWGTRLFTARELASSLRWRAVMNGFDISDGYHIAPLTGCTGELVLGFGITGVRRVYDGDPEWSPPSQSARTGRSSRPSARTAPRQSLSTAGACTSAAGRATAARPATSPSAVSSSTAACRAGPSPTSVRPRRVAP